jgi:small subunit ribosomal protein S1
MSKVKSKYVEKVEQKINNILDLALEQQKVLKVEDVIEGTVVAIEKSGVYVSVPPYGTGIIYGYEFIQAKDVIKKLNIGDSVTAKVVELENEKGYIELSLKEAKAALVWADAETAMKQKVTLSLPVKEANRGGLIVEWNGLQGFLPSSQLGKENYPKVEDGDKDKITKELKKLVGKKLDLQIITANPKEGKLIFSEKGEQSGKTGSSPSFSSAKAPAQKYAVGDVVEGTISGVVEFGLFVKMPDRVEGLVHISEISWSLIENPKAIYKAGEKIKNRKRRRKENKSI